jgi:hypothetical protein
VLVVAQIAFSLVVLIAAGLVVRTLQQLQTMSPGFDPESALTMAFELRLQGYDTQKGQQFYRQLAERVRELPGVKSAAVSSYLPLSLNYNSRNVFVEGQPAERGENAPLVMSASAGSRYFETMGTPLVQGRDFTEQDETNAEAVAVVNETFVRRFMSSVAPGSSDAISKRVSFAGPGGPFVRIVGVAKDGKYFNIAEEPRPFLWTPIAQNYAPGGILIVRTNTNPESLVGPVRNAVQSLDPNLPLFDIKTLKEHMKLNSFSAVGDRYLRDHVLHSRAAHPRDRYSAGAGGAVK